MRHLWTILIVVLLIFLSGAISGVAGLAWLSEPWLVGIGLMIILAYACGEALRAIGLPALLGYIAVGIFMGPSFASLMPAGFPFEVVTEEVISELALIQILIVGVIGMLAGGKFRIADVSGNLRLLIAIILAILLAVMPITVAGVLLTGQLFPESLLFLSDQAFGIQVTIALFFGVLAFGLSPSITVALIQEMRVRGPLATVILGVVILGEFVLFALFALMLSVGRAVVAPEALTAGVILEALPGVTWQLSLSTILGVALGWGTAIYLRFVRKETLLFLLAALIVAYYAVVAVDAEPLMTFLVAGFFVQNATKQGDILVRMLERIALPVFVIYFAVVAAGIDLEGALAYLPLVVVLIAARVTGLYWGVRFASKKAVETNRTYEYLRTAFISQDAVVLVLAGVVATQFPEWGPEFQSVVIATVIAYLIAGPILLKVGLDRSGETRRSRRPISADELPALPLEADPPQIKDLSQELPCPEFEDAWLRGHIEDLRTGLLDVSTKVLYEPARTQYQQLHDSLGQIDALIDGQSHAFTELVEGVAQGAAGEELTILVRDLQKEYSRQMQPVIQRIEVTQGISSEAARRFFEQVRNLENKESEYRIEREPSLLQITEEDTLPVKVLKSARKIQSRFSGIGYRTVPVGQLWRYYVELALPPAMAKTAPRVAIHYETFWRRLWRHLRRLDDFWEELIAELTGGGEEEPSPSSKAELVQKKIDSFLKEFRREQLELDEQARQGVALVHYSVASPLVDCYQRFLTASAHAGTIRLPAFRYRPSARFGQSRRSESRLADRLQRQEGIVAGFRGWIRLDHELSSFAQWARLFGTQIGETAERALGKGWQDQLREIVELCASDMNLVEEGRDIPEACESVYRDELRPRIAEFRSRQEELLARIHKGVATRSLQTRLESRISRVPQTVSVLAGEPEKVVLASASHHYDLPLRHWLGSQVTREMALRIVEFNERAEERIQRRLALLSNVEQILEFNLITTHKEQSEHPEEQSLKSIAREGLQRAAQLIDDYLQETRQAHDEILVWLQQELNTIISEAFEPIRARRLGEIQRELTRLEAASFVARGESWVSDFLEPVTDRLVRVRGRLGGWFSDVLFEVRSVLLEKTDTVDRFEIRKLLYAGEPVAQSEAPSIYRRLFVPMPLDIPEFYHHRDRAEDRLLETTREFFRGADHSILVTGPSGVGKRTFVQHIVPGRVYAVEGGLKDEQFITVRMALVDRDEASLAAWLAQAVLGRRGPGTFEELADRINRRRNLRQIVVVEQAERILLRTEEGLSLARRFLDMVEATSGTILWVVLLGDATATFLDTHLDLKAYFTHHQHLTGIDADQMEAMIMARHKVSGFDIEFAPPALRRLERLRRPVFGAEARRISRRVYFERLANRTGGNPRSALLHWLKSVRADPVDDTRILVATMEDRDVKILDPLTLRQQLVLATICLHRSISSADITTVLAENTDDIQREIRHLRRLGFVDIVPDTRDDYSIRPIATAWVERELRQLNLI